MASQNVETFRAAHQVQPTLILYTMAYTDG